MPQGDPERYVFPRFFDEGVEIANPEGGRNKVRVQRRNDGGLAEYHEFRDDQGKAGLSSVT